MSDQDKDQNKGNDDYNPDDLQKLSDLEHVRARPSMYIGDTTLKGLHHLVYEVVDNSIDEAMAGFASEIKVQINIEGSITVQDDGRGIPVDLHEQLSAEAEREVTALEGVMTHLKFGGKFKKGVYQTSGGLHGVGVTVVNFLSEWCQVEVWRSGHVYQQEYERGVPQSGVSTVGKTKKVGTKTTFKPDGMIFPVTKYEFSILHKRLQELAFLNKGAKISIRDARTDDHEEFLYENGIIEFVEHLNRSTDPLHSEVIYFSGSHTDPNDDENVVQYEIAIQYSTNDSESVHSYVNNINTHEGGTHVSGFRSALTRTLNAYGKQENLFKNISVTSDDFREGLTTVISMRIREPQFEGQTKTKLGNNEVEGIVNSVVGEGLKKYLEENPKTAKTILRKAIIAAEARIAAKRARELVKERKTVLGGGGLPGKLRDCLSNEVEKCELYLVEGDSAGGSAEGGRLKEFQAILPLRGKIINAYKAREAKVLENEEVKSMISAIRTGVGPDQDLSKRRYQKIIIMTDADVDGSHIRTLLLCFFYRQMNQLITGGHIYVAQPPLFRVKAGKKTYYVQSEEEMKAQLLDRGMENSTFEADESGTIEGEKMEKLCRILASMEESILALERRGINLKTHTERLNVETNRLPVFHVKIGTEQHWISSRKELDEFLKKHKEESGEELDIDDEESTEGESTSDAPTNGESTNGESNNGADNGNGESTTAKRMQIDEFHEVRTINTGLKDLLGYGFSAEALFPEDRTGNEDPRYLLKRGETEIGIEDLRGLLAAIRSAGEKGLQVTRFKGLGEMNAEELRETTLDPDNRTLIKVDMSDISAADDMFRILMGDKVEPRREFIEKHSLEVRNLDV